MSFFFFFQAEDGIRDLVRSRGLGDVYKRQRHNNPMQSVAGKVFFNGQSTGHNQLIGSVTLTWLCLLYTSDAADERSSVDLGGRRIIKKKKKLYTVRPSVISEPQMITSRTSVDISHMAESANRT